MAFKNASKTVFESGSYTYSILKRVFGNLILKFPLENFLQKHESKESFGNTVLKISQFKAKKKNGKVCNETLPFLDEIVRWLGMQFCTFRSFLRG